MGMSLFIAFPLIIVDFNQNHDCQPAGGTREEVRDSAKSLAFFFWVYHDNLSNFTEKVEDIFMFDLC